ncbi:unnamed protein product, partial [Iphiclides podalirius]
MTPIRVLIFQKANAVDFRANDVTRAESGREGKAISVHGAWARAFGAATTRALTSVGCCSGTTRAPVGVAFALLLRGPYAPASRRPGAAADAPGTDSRRPRADLGPRISAGARFKLPANLNYTHSSALANEESRVGFVGSA